MKLYTNVVARAVSKCHVVLHVTYGYTRFDKTRLASQYAEDVGPSLYHQSCHLQ